MVTEKVAGAAALLVIVPEENPQFEVPEVVRLFPFRSMVPVYPLTVIPAIVGTTSMTQFPLRPPVPSKITKSDEPGTDAPPAPPEVVDQLAVLLQLAVAAAIQ